mmetsp:Transcript_31324/g.68461  ORF Transcript_31324/g.68461 Transcript_31324/m.68461 type:complete len:412 (-) Transcript_31324:917-2152(-)|eukprot:CAMPEP_0118925534 /NCGR_PEP_ID=MMETSP1169-20130426/3407_1 /TAXON_ID=36882 /ORGANISM="Pyramimonas obovata, Strain CCMP722" /LENGTH=411 /DNA_ID=CAMNT_0006866867 /DNA_START=88 /DNA_END=1323 /DNA_ORIENTATION=+
MPKTAMLAVRLLVCIFVASTVGVTLAAEQDNEMQPRTMLGRRPLAAAMWHPKRYGTNKNEDGGSESAAPAQMEKKEEEETENQESPEGESSESSTDSGSTEAEEYAPFGRGTTDEEVLADPCPLIFAAFFASKPGGFDRAPGVRCNGCHESPMHITFDSAKIIHPTACVAVITDLETDFTNIKGLEGVQIHRFGGAVVNRSSIGTPNLMYERMKTYKAFVDRADKGGYKKNIVLLDTDIVIVGDVLHIFDQYQDFDYGLSARGNDNQPVQGGLQVVHKDRTAQASAWLALVLKDWEEHAATTRRREFGFTGDQYAYAKTIGNKAVIAKAALKNKIDSIVVKRDDQSYKILLVPADKYNRAPGGPGSNIKKNGVAVLHYKGGRKESMYVVYNALKKGGLKAVYALKGMTGKA